MTHEMRVINAALESPGKWILDLGCGCRVLTSTRKDCKKYPHKKRFCGTCWGKDQNRRAP